MKKDVVQVQIRGLMPPQTQGGCAIFLGNEEKVFAIHVDPMMAAPIGKYLNEIPNERPLTHDLMVNVFKGFNITVEHVVITEMRHATYFARIILHQANELGKKIVEIDARPSDCIALATALKRPIFVAASLFDEVEDMSEALERLKESGESESSET